MKSSKELIRELEQQLKQKAKTNEAAAYIICNYIDELCKNHSMVIGIEGFTSLLVHFHAFLLQTKPNLLVECMLSIANSIELLHSTMQMVSGNLHQSKDGNAFLNLFLQAILAENALPKIAKFIGCEHILHNIAEYNAQIVKKNELQGFFFNVLCAQLQKEFNIFLSTNKRTPNILAEVRGMKEECSAIAFLAFLNSKIITFESLEILIKSFEGYSIQKSINGIYYSKVINKIEVINEEAINSISNILNVIEHSCNKEGIATIYTSLQHVLVEKHCDIEKLFNVFQPLSGGVLYKRKILLPHVQLILHNTPKKTEYLQYLHSSLNENIRNELLPILDIALHNLASEQLLNIIQNFEKAEYQYIKERVELAYHQSKALETRYTLNANKFENLEVKRKERFQDSYIQQRFLQIIPEHTFEQFCKNNKITGITYQQLMQFNTNFNLAEEQQLQIHKAIYTFMMSCIVQEFLSSLPDDEIRGIFKANTFFADATKSTRYAILPAQEQETFIYLMVKTICYLEEKSIAEEKRIATITKLPGYEFLCLPGTVLKLNEVVKMFDSKTSIENILYNVKVQLIKKFINQLLFSKLLESSDMLIDLRQMIRRIFAQNGDLDQNMHVHSEFACFWILADKYKLDASNVEKDIHASDIKDIRLNRYEGGRHMHENIAQYIEIKFREYNIAQELTVIIYQDLKPFIFKLQESYCKENINALNTQILKLNSPKVFSNNNIFGEFGFRMLFIWDENTGKPLRVKESIQHIIYDLVILHLESYNFISLSEELKQVIKRRLEIELYICYEQEKYHYLLPEIKDSNLEKSVLMRCGYHKVANRNANVELSYDKWLYINYFNDGHSFFIEKLNSEILDCFYNGAIHIFRAKIEYIENIYPDTLARIDINSIFFNEKAYMEFEKYQILIHSKITVMKIERELPVEKLHSMLKKWGYKILNMSPTERNQLYNSAKPTQMLPEHNELLEFKLAIKIMQELGLLFEGRRNYLLGIGEELWIALLNEFTVKRDFFYLYSPPQLLYRVCITQIKSWINGKGEVEDLEKILLAFKNEFTKYYPADKLQVINALNRAITSFVFNDVILEKCEERMVHLISLSQVTLSFCTFKESNEYIRAIEILGEWKGSNKARALRAKKILDSIKAIEDIIELLTVLTPSVWSALLRLQKSESDFKFLIQENFPVIISENNIAELLFHEASYTVADLQKFKQIFDMILKSEWISNNKLYSFFNTLLCNSTLTDIQKNKLIWILGPESLQYSNFCAKVQSILKNSELFPNALDAVAKLNSKNEIERKIAELLMQWLNLPIKLLSALSDESLQSLFSSQCNKQDKFKDLQNNLLFEILKCEIPRLMVQQSEKSFAELQVLRSLLCVNSPTEEQDFFSQNFQKAVARVDFSFLLDNKFVLENAQKCSVISQWSGFKLLNRKIISDRAIESAVLNALINIYSNNILIQGIAFKVLAECNLQKCEIQQIKGIPAESLRDAINIYTFKAQKFLQHNTQYRGYIHTICKRAITLCIRSMISKVNNTNIEEFHKECYRLLQNVGHGSVKCNLLKMVLDNTFLYQNASQMTIIFQTAQQYNMLYVISEVVNVNDKIIYAIRQINEYGIKNLRAKFVIDMLSLDKRIVNIFQVVSEGTVQEFLEQMKLKKRFSTKIFQNYNNFLSVILPIEIKNLLNTSNNVFVVQFEQLKFCVKIQLLNEYLRRYINENNVAEKFPEKHQLLIEFVEYIPLSKVITSKTKEDSIIFRLCRLNSSSCIDQNNFASLGFSDAQIKVIMEVDSRIVELITEAFLRNKIKNIQSVPFIECFNNNSIHFIYDMAFTHDTGSYNFPCNEDIISYIQTLISIKKDSMDISK